MFAAPGTLDLDMSAAKLLFINVISSSTLILQSVLAHDAQLHCYSFMAIKVWHLELKEVVLYSSLGSNVCMVKLSIGCFRCVAGFKKHDCGANDHIDCQVDEGSVALLLWASMRCVAGFMLSNFPSSLSQRLLTCKPSPSSARAVPPASSAPSTPPPAFRMHCPPGPCRLQSPAHRLLHHQGPWHSRVRAHAHGHDRLFDVVGQFEYA